MLDKIGETGLVTVGKVIDGLRAGSADNYVDYTRPSRVEPNLIVDSSLLMYSEISTVTQSLHSAFSAYYLLAWNQMGATSDQVVARQLGKLNPNRHVGDTLLDSAGAIWNIASLESYGHRLPKFGKSGLGVAMGFAPSLEARNGGNVVRGYRLNQLPVEDQQAIVNEAIGRQAKETGDAVRKEIQAHELRQRNQQEKDDLKASLSQPGGLAARSTEVIKEMTNMSVGKILEVQVNVNGSKQTLPILVRLQASVMVPNLLSELLTTGNADNSVGSRIIKYKSGQINLIDLLTARDLVIQHRKNLKLDKTGVYTALSNQKRNNRWSGLLSLNPSVANSTNLVVVNATTIKEAELKANISFKNFKDRQALFEHTGLFIVAVVDTEYDRVKFYTTGIPSVSDLSIRECKASNKSEGASITDILKAYQLGNAPSF